MIFRIKEELNGIHCTKTFYVLFIPIFKISKLRYKN